MLFRICFLAALSLAPVAHAAPNTQVQDLLPMMMSKLEQSGLSAEDAAPAEGDGATTEADTAATAAAVGTTAAAAGITPAAENKLPDKSSPTPSSQAVGAATVATSSQEDGGSHRRAETPADDAASPESAATTTPAPSVGASTLPGGLSPIPLPEGVSPEELPPGAVPIKLENGKITFAVVGKKMKNSTQGSEDVDFDEEVLKTTMFQKIKAIFHHIRVHIKRFLKERWNQVKGVALTGGRALGDTVDTAKTFLSISFTVIANILRQLADFLERLPPTKLASLGATVLSIPMIPLTIGRAILEATFFSG